MGKVHIVGQKPKSIFDGVNQAYTNALKKAQENPSLEIEPSGNFHKNTIEPKRFSALWRSFWWSTRPLRESIGIEAGTTAELAHKIMFIDAIDNTRKPHDKIDELIQTSARNMFFGFLAGFTVGSNVFKCNLPRGDSGEYLFDFLSAVQDKFPAPNGFEYSADELARICAAIEFVVEAMLKTKNATEERTDNATKKTE